MEILGKECFRQRKKQNIWGGQVPGIFLEWQGDQSGWRETKKKKVVRDDIREIMGEENTVEPRLVWGLCWVILNRKNGFWSSLREDTLESSRITYFPTYQSTLSLEGASTNDFPDPFGLTIELLLFQRLKTLTMHFSEREGTIFRRHFKGNLRAIQKAQQEEQCENRKEPFPELRERVMHWNHSLCVLAKHSLEKTKFLHENF